MSALAAARTYLDAWNAHDAAALSAVFTKDGTYEDSATGRPIPAAAIAVMARTMWSTLPDLRFEAVRMEAAGEGLVVLEWRMRGTCTGKFRGRGPTGRAVDLPGVDLIDVEGPNVRRVRGYFDTRALDEQIGA